MSTIPGTAHSRTLARVRGWAAGVAEDPTLVVLSVTIVLVFAGFSIARPDFLSVENVRNIGQQTAVIAIVAVAMTVVILGRGLDISAGSTVALAGVVGALLLRDGAGTAVALVAVVLAGAGVGVVNGTLVGAFNVSPFMATLATLAAARGAALLLASDSGVAVDNGTISWFGEGGGDDRRGTTRQAGRGRASPLRPRSLLAVRVHPPPPRSRPAPRPARSHRE